MATNIGEINKEVAQRCRNAGLEFACGCDGIFNAEVAIIGEYPGERECALHSPLVGGSGHFLWDILRRYNLSRRRFFITNVVKRRVATAKGAAESAETPALNHGELEQWQSILNWELSQLPNLKYVLVLGSHALKAITGNNSITHWRGSVIDASLDRFVTMEVEGVPVVNTVRRPITVMCAVNPAFVLRTPIQEVSFRQDMDKFYEMINGRYTPYNIEAIINPSYKDVMDWLRRMKCSTSDVSFDIETIANETACIGLTDDDHLGMCINFRTQSEPLYTLPEEREIRLGLQDLFADPKVKLVAQNGGFDSYWLWYKDRIRVRKIWFDTLLAHHTLYPVLPHNLGYLTAQYTSHPYYKDEGKDWRETDDIEQFWRYNVKDVCITHRIAARELEELREQHLEKFFFEHVMRLQPHLVEMTVLGIRVDRELKEKIGTELSEDVARLKQEFYAAVQAATGDPGYCPNPSSPKQMQELYFRRLHLVGRGISVDAENRKRMRDHPRTTEECKHIIDLHNKYAVDDKFLGTYAESKIDPDGRARCDWKQYGVAKAPGRLSSAQVMWGSGFNLQNQPVRAQVMFIADEVLPWEDDPDDPYVLVYFDESQIEARIVGWLANIPKWIEQFERARHGGGYDAHRALASEMFHLPYEDVPTFDRYDDEHPPTEGHSFGEITIRYKAKRCRHGLNYRMGPERLATVLGISIREAEDLYQIYHWATPELRVWWDNLIHEVKENRVLYSPLGRRWILLERFDEKALESIVAFKPQSTAGDHVSGCIYKCQEDPEWPVGKARIVLNIHDALIALCRRSVHKKVLRIMKKYAEEPMMVNGRELIVPAEFAVSHPDEHGVHRWSTLKKIKNFEEYVES